MSDESLFASMHRPMRGVITAEGEARVERGWMTQEPPAAVAPFKPATCVGLLGMRCTCGKWHEPPQEGPGLLLSPEFWAVGACCMAVWAIVIGLIGQRFGWW